MDEVKVERVIAALQAELAAWRSAMMDLTPGGSEYADDPQACLRWAREARARQHEAIVDGVKQRKDLQAQLRQAERERDEAQALVSERASMIGSLTAALRRAKAEGVRLAVQEHRCWEDMLRTEYRNVPTFVPAFEAWIDARAAQIEEGE